MNHLFYQLLSVLCQLNSFKPYLGHLATLPFSANIVSAVVDEFGILLSQVIETHFLHFREDLMNKEIQVE